jgi:hypothetical protein
MPQTCTITFDFVLPTWLFSAELVAVGFAAAAAAAA